MSTEKKGRPANRLKNEKSPYLQQHAHNPVDWHPWGEEALSRARKENKPIFLSIGYSTCHWCHVMERESFEDEKVGAFLKEYFISIKVDREERPDIDKIYMMFVQVTTGAGGWPLNVFLTPELKPFYGGTYFPPEPRHGRPSLLQLLQRVKEAADTKREDLVESADELTGRLKSMLQHEPANAFPTGERELHGAGQAFMHEYDPENGGFDDQPKFPRPSQPLFLLRYARRFGEAQARQAVLHTCDRMAAGGIFDQLGGGFARYSVDRKWLVPHFEKMLYDNAQLMQLYLDAYLVSGDSRHADVVRAVAAYVLRDMTQSDGGFYSAEDADSEGKEGKFYCWTRAELKALLTAPELAVVERVFGVTESGNFTDHSDPSPLLNLNVLSVVDGKVAGEERAALSEAKKKMLAARSKRVRPHRDDKVLASWNGMMLGAMARAGAVLDDAGLRRAAERNAAFLRERLWDEKTGTLYHRWREGERDSVQLLDGYAHVLSGVLEAYEATLNPQHLEWAVALAEGMVKRFYDAQDGGFWQAGEGTPHLLVRVKEDYDGAEPSGNSVAALALLKLAAVTGRKEWRDAAEKTLRLFAQKLHQMPGAVPHLLSALDFSLQEPKRVVIVGDPSRASTAELLRGAHAVYEPNKVVLGHRGPVEPFAKGLPVNAEHSVAYCCTGTECLPPTREREAVEKFLKKTPAGA